MRELSITEASYINMQRTYSMNGQLVNHIPETVEVIRCKDCKHQEVTWHKDKRMKEGGYNLYWCDLCDDPFVGHGVCGEPDGYCSLAERRES